MGRLLTVVQSWLRIRLLQGCIAVAVSGMHWLEVATMHFRTRASTQQVGRHFASVGSQVAQRQVGLHRKLDEVEGCSTPLQAEGW